MDTQRTLLEQFFARHFPNRLPLHGLVNLSRSAARETWRIEGQGLILRAERPDAPYGLTLEQEFRVHQVVEQGGVLVPRLYTDDVVSGVWERPFYLMDDIDGVTSGRQITQAAELAAARALLLPQLAAQLARVHSIDYAPLGFLPMPRAGYSPAREAVAQLHESITALSIESPTLEFGVRWAERHAPDDDRWTLVHGDFRVGNFIVGDDGLRAIIDWKFAHVGDPMEEIGYLCVRDWRFGMGRHQVGGIGDLETFLAAYEEAAGRVVNRSAVAWWEVVGNLRRVLACFAQSAPQVEFAQLGRRAAEMELEVLRLIERQGF